MNASPPTETTRITTAPPPLWRVAEAFMRMLHALFGDPSHIAASHTLTLKAHQLMASWLRTGEAMMRRLLLIEAAAHAKPNTRPLLREPRQRARKLMGFTPEAPEKWRVSFRCFLDRRLPAGTSFKPPTATSEQAAACRPEAVGPRPFIFREDRPLRTKTPNRAQRRRAERRKPMLRQDRLWVKHESPLVFRSAWPLAERYEALLRVFNDPIAYARRLARRLHATPHRIRELLHAPPEAAQRVDQFDMLTGAAETHAAVFNSS